MREIERLKETRDILSRFPNLINKELYYLTATIINIENEIKNLRLTIESQKETIETLEIEKDLKDIHIEELEKEAKNEKR